MTFKIVINSMTFIQHITCALVRMSEFLVVVGNDLVQRNKMNRKQQ